MCGTDVSALSQSFVASTLQRMPRKLELQCVEQKVENLMHHLFDRLLTLYNPRF